MEKFSKKTLLNYVNGAGLYGAAPTGSSVVKFAWASTLEKIGTGGDGTITFYADANNTGIIAVGDQIVSSKIFDVTSADKGGGKAGEKTITVTYFDAATKTTKTTPFEVVNAAAAKEYFEDYFKTSNTIDVSNGVANVRVDGTTILVDSIHGLKSGLKIAYVAEHGSVGAQLQLQDKDGNVQGDAIEVSEIVGDGILKDSVYHQDTNVLELRFGNGKTYSAKDPTTYTVVNVDLQKLIDINDVFIGDDSSIYLKATLDASTVTLGTKMQDPASATESATGLADAWKVKQYVDSKANDLEVTGAGDGTYINLEQDGTNKKKLNASAFVNELTYAAGTDDAHPATLTGEAGLIDGAQAATAITNFVNQRLSQKVDTLDASIDSIGTTFVEVGVAEVDGKITNVKVTEHVGSISGTATDLTGTAGLIDGANAASAVKTYVDGQIDASIKALDADITSDDATYTTVEVVEVDGKITDVVVSQTKSVITASANALSATAGIADGSEFAAGVKTYVDGQIDALDSELNITSDDASLTFDASVVNGKIVEGHIGYVKSTVDAGANDLNLTGTAGFVTGEAIAKIKAYVDAKAGALDSDITESDSSAFVSATIAIVDGALNADDSSISVKYADLTAAPGTITVNAAGIATGNDVKKAVEGALTWTLL